MTDKKEAFSTTTTIFITIFLIVPFLIRSLAPALEPYPAVALPLGVGLFDIENNEIDIETTQVLGQTKRGNWERIEPAKFLEPIPPHYIYKIAESNFGLIKQDQKEINTAFWGRVEVPRKPITNHDINLTQQWIRDRLNDLGYQNSTFLMRKTVKSIDLKTDSVKSEFILEETKFELD